MRRGTAVAVALVLATAPAAAMAQRPPVSVTATAPTAAPPATAPAASTGQRQAPAAARAATAVTPNAERIVTIGAINKRTGETRTFSGNPGQVFDFGSLHVTVRACETTPPWEQKLSGAFLLIDERLLRGGARRVYSGWMFAQSPSLHPLEHPRYDIWVKSCTMRFPETGPNTVVIGRSPGPAAAPAASSAKKSAETPIADAN
jgi:hypothetical protein